MTSSQYQSSNRHAGNNQQTTCLVLLVKDSINLLPEFIAHHSHLFDQIHIIDHNSSFDLAVVANSQIHVYRAQVHSYFQEEFTNTVIRHLLKTNLLDWLFVLDVDEFLPFKNRLVFNNFLETHKSDRIITFNWRNGAPCDFDTNEDNRGVSDSKELIFYKLKSSTVKCAVNVNKVGRNFYIPRSNHRVETWFNSYRYFWRRPATLKLQNTGLEIFHILSVSLEDFQSKINKFKSLRRIFDGVKGHGGSMIYKYPDHVDKLAWLTHTANYRVGDPNKHPKVSRDDFLQLFDFKHCDPDYIANLRRKLRDNPCEPLAGPSDQELKIVNLKKQFGQKTRMLAHFQLDVHTKSITTQPNPTNKTPSNS